MESKNFYTIDSEDSSNLDLEHFVDEASDSKTLNLEHNEVLRIEEEVSRRFSGVRGCSDSSTHNSNATAAMNEWAQRKIFENRNLRYIRFGHLGGTAHWTNRTAWDGTRSCTGYVVIKCFIEFRKP
jgi:hypothetical protein